MQKIKAIYERLHRSPSEYSDIRLIIAKNFFAIFAFLYFTGFLFSIGGFTVGPMSLVMWSAFLGYLFPVFVGSICWLLYCLGDYLMVVMIGKAVFIKYAIGIFLLILWGVVMLLHLDLIHINFSSFL